MSHSGVLDHGRCSICLEDYVPVTNPCSDKSHSSACTECLRGYISGLINNAYVGSCPIFSCPICLASKSDCKSKARPRLLPAAEMLNLLSHETERMLYDKFVNDLTSIQCSGCHSRQSLNVTWDREYAWPVLVVGMPDTSKVSTLENALNQLDNGDITIEECYKIISVNVYPFMQSKADEDRVALIFERVLMCVREPERRANLQLRYLRDRPFVNSPCCKKPHCFNCKSRNWHEGKSCQENSNTFFDGKILPCPSCGIQLTKGDGCDSIT